MNFDRRTALRLAGLGAGTALAGCLGLGDDNSDEETPAESPNPGEPTPSVDIDGHDTMPLALRNASPLWYRDDGGDEDPVGHAVISDTRERTWDAIGRYDLPEQRADDVESFLREVDYETDRVVLVESVGPDSCHNRLEIGGVGLEDGRLQAEATVREDSDGQVGCTDALVYPSTLLSITFEGPPADELSLEVTDGADETATVTASVDDPLLSPDPSELPGYVRPEADPEPTSPLSCDRKETKRHDQWYDEADVQWGDYEGKGDHYDGPDGTVLSLRVEDREYEYGETATITLTNVAGESVETGNHEKFNLQVYTEDGWQDVRVKDDDDYFEYTDEAVGHPPGDGFQWSVELTESGIVEGTYHDDAEVCPDLKSGRYRFGYFGVIGDGAVAASFEVTR